MNSFRQSSTLYKALDEKKPNCCSHREERKEISKHAVINTTAKYDVEYDAKYLALAPNNSFCFFRYEKTAHDS